MKIYHKYSEEVQEQELLKFTEKNIYRESYSLSTSNYIPRFFYEVGMFIFVFTSISL
jgi:hypothetical protein